MQAVRAFVHLPSRVKVGGVELGGVGLGRLSHGGVRRVGAWWGGVELLQHLLTASDKEL